ncbi:MAG: glycosyltransferase [Bacteroidales bacterium]|nr:glycosyltransferase [Candidatus Physcousia equi]
MLTILINAYACGPNRGSEPGMAWNWCCHLAKHCVLHIITEGEFREDIERVLSTLEYGHNMHFYYLPVGEKIRRMCWNQGDWRFYYYYAKWQKRALNEALRIIASTHIDVLHQLNMIGFREPGYLYSIKRIPLVWGPIGGIKQFPLAYARGGGLRLWMFSAIKNILNRLQLEYAPRINKAFKRADILVSSIPDSQTGIKKYVRRDSILIPETGCFESLERDETRSHNFENVTFRILWIGKFDFRKRLDIAIKAIGAANLPNVHLKVFGTGNKEQIKAAKNLVDRLGLHGQVHLMGAVRNDRIMQEMREADLFFFSSINEDTSTVVLEAVSNHLPVLCFDCCGMAAVIDSTVGVKVPLTNPEQSVKDFAERIDYLYHHRDELQRMSEGCKAKRQELSWEKKAEQMVEVYHKAMAEHSEN